MMVTRCNGYFTQRCYIEMKKFKVSGQICFRLLGPSLGLWPKPIDERISGRKKRRDLWALIPTAPWERGGEDGAISVGPLRKIIRCTPGLGERLLLLVGGSRAQKENRGLWNITHSQRHLCKECMPPTHPGWTSQERQNWWSHLRFCPREPPRVF